MTSPYAWILYLHIGSVFAFLLLHGRPRRLVSRRAKGPPGPYRDAKDACEPGREILLKGSRVRWYRRGLGS